MPILIVFSYVFGMVSGCLRNAINASYYAIKKNKKMKKTGTAITGHPRQNSYIK